MIEPRQIFVFKLQVIFVNNAIKFDLLMKIFKQLINDLYVYVVI